MTSPTEPDMSDIAGLEAAIETAWEARETLSSASKGEARDAIEATLAALDSG